MSPPDVPARRLRPAIEAAMRVARAGEEADPVEPAPAALRRYLSFSRLPTPALDVARRVIEEDQAFRERVAEAITPDEAGEAGWLWLTRPTGWETQLGEMVGRAERRRQAASAARDERSLQRRIGELEEAARRLEAAGAADRALAAAIRVDLDDERARRRDAGRLAEERLAALAAAEDAAAAAEAVAEAAEAVAAAAQASAARATAEVARLTAELGRATARAAELERDAAGAGPPAAGAGPPTLEEASSGSGTAQPPRVDRDAVRRIIGVASAALAEAVALLDGAGRAGPPVGAAPRSPGPPRPPGPLRPPPGSPRPPPGSLAGPTSAAPAGARAAPSGRTHTRLAVKLPGGVLDDGVEAAEYLVRVPSALLLVDGYNISNALAPGQPLKEQRARLVDALSELHARTGTAVEVVFDGGEAPDPWISGGRPSIHVQFSPPAVEADDVLVDRIAALPPGRPVILATSDRALRDRARRHGANLLGARQLIAVMRR